MTDDAFYRPNRPPPPPRPPKPGEPLWTLRHDHATRELRTALSRRVLGLGDAAPREGELVIGRRFDLRRLAEQWAEEERKLVAR